MYNKTPTTVFVTQTYNCMFQFPCIHASPFHNMLHSMCAWQDKNPLKFNRQCEQEMHARSRSFTAFMSFQMRSADIFILHKNIDYEVE